MRRRRIFFLNHLSSYVNSLGDSLQQMGHSLYYQTSWDMAEIEAGIKRFRPDLLITVGIDKPMFHPDMERIPELCRAYGLLHIYWATEDGIHFETISKPFTARVRPDVVWTIHPDCVAKYGELGIEAHYLNFAFNPRLFPAKAPDGAEPYAISFVGTTHLETRTFRYDSLKQLLFPLLAAQIETNVWGLNWLESREMLLKEFGLEIPERCIRGYLPYKRTSEVYRKSKIVLGVQNADDQVTQRTFEILGSGAFMIGSRTKELDRMFEHGKELVLSSEPGETLEYVDFYLRRPEERFRIGQRARQKVLASHTFAARLAEVWPKAERRLNS